MLLTYYENIISWPSSSSSSRSLFARENPFVAASVFYVLYYINTTPFPLPPPKLQTYLERALTAAVRCHSPLVQRKNKNERRWRAIPLCAVDATAGHHGGGEVTWGYFLQTVCDLRVFLCFSRQKTSLQ